jgi:hypothetical protein
MIGPSEKTLADKRNRAIQLTPGSFCTGWNATSGRVATKYVRRFLMISLFGEADPPNAHVPMDR